MNRFFSSKEPLGQRPFWLAFTVVALLALVLRLPTLASRSLWLDETYSAWFSSLPLAELWTSVPLYETHPPMYYTLLKAWTGLFGTTEIGLRSLSVCASVVSVMLLAASARWLKLCGTAQRAGLLAALFLAFNAGSIDYAQQARPYALQTVAATIAVLSSLVLLRSFAQGAPGAGARSPGRLWPWAASLGIAAGCTLWLHNTGFFVALGLWSGLLLATLLFTRGKWREAIVLSVAAGVLALLVWSPFLSMFLRQNAALAGMHFWLSFRPGHLPGAWILPLGGAWAAMLGVPLAVLGLVRLWRTQRALACHVAVLLLLAPLLMGAYSYFIKPVFVPRLFIWTGPLLMAVVAGGVFALPRVLRAPVAGIVLAVSAFATWSHYGKPTENWREMLAVVEARLQPGDLVFILPNEIQLPIAYYQRDSQLAARAVYLPAAFPALGLARDYVANLGAPAVGAPDVARVQALVTPGRRVWLIERRADLFDRNRTVAAALGARLTPVETIKGRGMTITLFDVRRPAP